MNGARQLPKYMRQVSADKISRGAAYGQSQKKDREHAAALEWRKGIGNQRGSNGRVTGFTNADNGVTEKKLVIVMHEPGKKSEAAPDEDAEDHNVFAGKAVAHPAHDRRGKHISKEEGAREQADLGVADQKFFFTSDCTAKSTLRSM